MELNKAIETLKEYIVIDRETRETRDYTSDFDRFCEEKCVAIETLINHIERRN